MALTVGSLFSGIGGLDLGFERAGFVIKWQVEIDPYCRKVLHKHWPAVPCYEDVRTAGVHNLEPVDVLVGGFPCQPVSSSGVRRAQTDERWLWPQYARLIGELRPRYAVMENVAGLLYRGLGDVLGDLAACGYDAEWQSLPALAFGAPHRRDRLFIVAYPAGRGCDRRVYPNEHQWECEEMGWREQSFWNGGNGIVAYPNGKRREEQRGTVTLSACYPRIERASWWEIEPNVGRVVDGFPGRVHRLRGLGNAVVPQVAQYVAECVKAHAEHTLTI